MNANFHRESVIFMKRTQQGCSSRITLSEDEYYTEPAEPHTQRIWDNYALTLGDWLITLGNQLKTHSGYTKLSEKQV